MVVHSVAVHKTLNIYTDGWKMKDGQYISAEVFAIGKDAELASNASAGNSRVNIYVESQAAIKAVTTYCISTRSIFEKQGNSGGCQTTKASMAMT